jgi:hypothetical protein
MLERVVGVIHCDQDAAMKMFSSGADGFKDAHASGRGLVVPVASIHSYDRLNQSTTSAAVSRSSPV